MSVCCSDESISLLGSVMITADSIEEQDVWVWCSDAYLRNGIKLRLPQCLDHTKTYQWRYVRALTNKFVEWEFNRETCIKFIDVAVKYAKDLKVLNKGLSIFHQHNMLKICYNKLQESSGVDENLRVRLEDSVRAMSKIDDRKAFFLKRQDSLSFRNITNYYMNKKLCKEYLALSKAAIGAMKALSTIDAQERQLLPSDAALYLLRIRILDQHGDSEMIKDIINA